MPRRTWSSCCWAIRCVQGPRPPWGLLCCAVPLLSPWLCRDGALPAPSSGFCFFLGPAKRRGGSSAPGVVPLSQMSPGFEGSGRAVFPIASGWQHEPEVPGTECPSSGMLWYGMPTQAWMHPWTSGNPKP